VKVQYYPPINEFIFIRVGSRRRRYDWLLDDHCERAILYLQLL